MMTHSLAGKMQRVAPIVLEVLVLIAAVFYVVVSPDVERARRMQQEPGFDVDACTQMK